MKIAILGAGSWGTALGQLLQENGIEVTLWHPKQDFVNKVNSNHIHPFLNNIKLSNNLKFLCSLELVLKNVDMIVSALPSQVVRSVFTKIPFECNQPIISVSKGIENKTGMRVSEVIVDVLNIQLEQIVVLSGPSHAEEVAKKFPTAIVASGLDHSIAHKVQKIFSNDYFRVYTNNDIIGVEIGGATKNVIALAAGICHGLGFGDNTISALVTRGLEEIIRLGINLGAMRTTFAGLSGMGDLIVTAFSEHSRNRQVGFQIGKGKKMDQILQEMDMVAEGIETTRSLYYLSKNKNIDMPICNQMYQVLFNNIDPKQAIHTLMNRELIEEHSV